MKMLTNETTDYFPMKLISDIWWWIARRIQVCPVSLSLGIRRSSRIRTCYERGEKKLGYKVKISRIYVETTQSLQSMRLK
jgi:hypothetical protein